MDAAIAAFKVTGLCSAPFQPFHANGDVNYEAIAQHCEELVRQGVFYAFVAGTTGEGLTLSVDERKAVVEAWLKASAGRVGVIAHVGAESPIDVKALSAHAEAKGCVAIGVQPPVFFKPDGIESIISYLELVASAAPHTPLYYYHLVIKTGVAVRCDLLLKRIAELQKEGRLTSFRGIKYSDADLHILSSCIAAPGYVKDASTGAVVAVEGAFDMLYGKDEQLLGALSMGCKGAVGSTYNYTGRNSNAVIAAFNKGDMAAALSEQRKVQKVVDLLYAGGSYGPLGSTNVGKAIMALRIAASTASEPTAAAALAGVQKSDASGPPRCPGAGVTPEGYAKLAADLDKLGFFSW